MALTYNQQFETELRKAVTAEIDRLTEEVAFGSMVDHAAYRNHCGQIAGLRKTLELCDDIRTEMDKR